MPPKCAKCGSKEVRVSQSQSISERLWEFIGVLHFRCKECDHRFVHSIWDVRNAAYAHCPRCDRVDLATWSVANYRVPRLWKLQMKVGAKPWRCNACRCNFVSFRARKSLPAHQLT